MGYLRLPDVFPFASQTVEAGNEAIGCYVRLAAWAAGNGTDGFVQVAMARMMGSRKDLETLEKHRLVESVGEGEVRIATRRVSNRPDAHVVMPADGYWLSDLLTYNLTSQEGEVLSARGRKAGQASAASRSTKEHRIELDAEQQVPDTFNRHVRSGHVNNKQPLSDGADIGSVQTSSEVDENDARARDAAVEDVDAVAARYVR